MRIYVDTSVFGGCLEPEFELASRRLFSRFRVGEDILVISDITAAELERAPQPVQDVLSDVPVRFVERWAVTQEAEALAERYLRERVIPARMRFDVQHIAVATVAAVDVLVSWNFKHIVNLQRIRGYNTVNASLGYPPVEIRTPQAVGHMKDDANVGYVPLLRRLRDEMNEQASTMTLEERARFVRESAERLARRIPLPDYAGHSDPVRRQARGS